MKFFLERWVSDIVKQQIIHSAVVDFYCNRNKEISNYKIHVYAEV